MYAHTLQTRAAGLFAERTTASLLVDHRVFSQIMSFSETRNTVQEGEDCQTTSRVLVKVVIDMTKVHIIPYTFCKSHQVNRSADDIEHGQEKRNNRIVMRYRHPAITSVWRHHALSFT